MQNIYHGSCLCGEVTYSVTGFSSQVANCHCTMCRKFHGAAFGTLVSVSNLTWLSGENRLKEYVATNGTKRTFCNNCGSSLGFLSKGASPSEIEISISTFNSDLPIKVDAQIFTQNKANWCSLHEDVPAYLKARED